MPSFISLLLKFSKKNENCLVKPSVTKKGLLKYAYILKFLAVDLGSFANKWIILIKNVLKWHFMTSKSPNLKKSEN